MVQELYGELWIWYEQAAKWQMFQLISKAAMQRLFFFSFLFLFYRLLKWDSIKPLIDHKTIVTKATLH